jgi:hypothetical protein
MNIIIPVALACLFGAALGLGIMFIASVGT